MYDIDGNGKIDKEELLTLLTLMAGENVSQDQLHMIAERTISEADTDADNCISFDEFFKILEHTDVDIKMSIKI